MTPWHTHLELILKTKQLTAPENKTQQSFQRFLEARILETCEAYAWAQGCGWAASFFFFFFFFFFFKRCMGYIMYISMWYVRCILLGSTLKGCEQEIVFCYFFALLPYLNNCDSRVPRQIQVEALLVGSILSKRRVYHFLLKLFGDRFLLETFLYLWKG